MAARKKAKGIFRQFYTLFWSDTFVLKLSIHQKYFFNYLLTNDRTKQCGIYELSLDKTSFETGLSKEEIGELLQFFIDAGKIDYSPETGEVLIVNWLKYNYNPSQTVAACIYRELQDVKNRRLLSDAFEKLTEMESYSNLNERQELHERVKRDTMNTTRPPSKENVEDLSF